MNKIVEISYTKGKKVYNEKGEIVNLLPIKLGYELPAFKRWVENAARIGLTIHKVERLVGEKLIQKDGHSYKEAVTIEDEETLNKLKARVKKITTPSVAKSEVEELKAELAEIKAALSSKAPVESKPVKVEATVVETKQEEPVKESAGYESMTDEQLAAEYKDKKGKAPRSDYSRETIIKHLNK
jgi:hypothetical protein